MRSGAVDLIVIDWVAALVPKAEIEGEMGDSLPGLEARLMSQALRKLTATIKKTNCTVIFINQIRMKIGVMFGSPETTTGGNALKFYASVRLDIRRTGSIKKGDNVIGNETKVKVVKNKVSPPFKTAAFDISFGEGISRMGEIIDMGVEAKILDKSGARYAYNGEKIGQGRDNTREFLKENPALAAEIENKVRAPGRGPGRWCGPSRRRCRRAAKPTKAKKARSMRTVSSCNGRRAVKPDGPGAAPARPARAFAPGVAAQAAALCAIGGRAISSRGRRGRNCAQPAPSPCRWGRAHANRRRVGRRAGQARSQRLYPA